MIQSTNSGIELPYPAAKLVIHRSPMLLIDQLITREGDTATASAVVDQTSICYHEETGILPEFFIEIMAQTMAAANGYDALQLNTPPNDGFIVGLDNFILKKIPQAQGEFLVQIEKKMEFSAMKIMEGRVLRGGTTIATVELKVWEQNPDEK